MHLMRQRGYCSEGGVEEKHGSSGIHESMTSIFDDLWRPAPLTRGGWRMRLAANAAQPPVRQRHTILRLLEDDNRGRIGAIQLWRHMDCLKRDGFEHPGIPGFMP